MILLRRRLTFSWSGVQKGFRLLRRYVDPTALRGRRAPVDGPTPERVTSPSSDWRYVLASVPGTSHVRAGLPCQDAGACEILYSVTGEPVLVAVVSDGAGSASRSAEGSALTCERLVEAVSEHLTSGGSVLSITEEWVCRFITSLREEITARAGDAGLRARDFACTVVAAIVGTDGMVFFQIGDGAIVIAPTDETDEYNWIFWPQRGEYANVTFFLTDSVSLDHLEYAYLEGSVAELAVFTDGLQGLALHYASESVYAPFFKSLFGPLRAEPAGFRRKLSEMLAVFLDSPDINSRTDDDKTIVLASRHAEPLNVR